MKGASLRPFLVQKRLGVTDRHCYPMIGPHVHMGPIKIEVSELVTSFQKKTLSLSNFDFFPWFEMRVSTSIFVYSYRCIYDSRLGTELKYNFQVLTLEWRRVQLLVSVKVQFLWLY